MESPSNPSSSLPNDRRALLAGIGGLAAGTFLTAGRAEAGPLNPPGSPESTPGPEPRIAINAQTTPGGASSVYRIALAGSYYLNTNLLGVAGRHGLVIAASNVSVDLMGFSVTGASESMTGIVTEGTSHHVSIRNGRVVGWGTGGINLVAGGAGSGAQVENVIAASNSADGITVGPMAIVRHCSSFGHLDGFGIVAAEGCQVSTCNARSNNLGGIRVGQGSVVSRCVARENANTGIQGLEDCLVENCSATSNTTGIGVDQRSTVLDCTAATNNGVGILAQSGCMVSRCTSTQNGLHGIRVFFGCVVRDNLCRANGVSGIGAGIFSSANETRLEQNNCVENDQGIHLTGSGNILLRNTCSGNTTANWDIAANNCGLVAVAGLNLAFSGNSGGVLLGSTDANANYTF
jgi:parallel beta-helix repeat protein